MSSRAFNRKPRFPALYLDRGVFLLGGFGFGFLAVGGTALAAWWLTHHRLSLVVTALVLSGLWIGFAVFLRGIIKERAYLFGTKPRPYFEVHSRGVVYRGELVARIEDVRRVRAVTTEGWFRARHYLSLVLDTQHALGARELRLRIYNHHWAAHHGLNNTVQLIWKMARDYGKPLPGGPIARKELT